MQKVYDREVLKQHIREWLDDLAEEERPREEILAELRARLATYEKKYGRPSEGVSEAVGLGEIDETYEVCMWIMDYREWRDLQDAQ